MTARRGVVYQISKTRHAGVLVCSVLALGEQWRGPVQIIAGCDDSEAVAQAIAEDSRLSSRFEGLHVTRWNAPLHGKGVGYANKCEVLRLCEFEEAVFLDADTIPVGSFEGLWPAPGAAVTLTQFCDWVSTGSRISGRTEKWRGVAPELVAASQSRAYPAINTGVFSFERGAGAAWFDQWRELTHKNLSFICDEIAAQLLVTDLATEPVRVVDSRFNASPIYSGEPVDVRVWHFHGKKHLRRAAGRALWLPYWERAAADNLARVNEWVPAGLGDKTLRAFLQDRRRFLEKYPD